MANSNYDLLGLQENVSLQKMLSKIGDNFPVKEKVVLSVNVIKINKRKKEQKRILVLTNKALYNLKPKELHKCQRRVDIKKIVSITTSTISDEFALHIPEQYDYRYISNQKKNIIETLSKLYKKKQGKNIGINRIKLESTENYAVNKDVARLQSREERLNRYRELIGKDNYEDEYKTNTYNTKQLIESNKKVNIDDFEFVKGISRTSRFSKIIKVRKKDNREIFAMKIIKTKLMTQNQQKGDEVKMENQILQSLKHPFLIHLHYAFKTDKRLYFVLTYYEGGELFFHLKQKRRFTEYESQFFVAETGLALGHLHSFNIIYRDLKPENILLDNLGHIYLYDFGLSRDLGSDNEDAHTFCGTPEYLSPEVVTNLGYGKAVDWWSLGILLYELCVGIPPFYSQNISEMYQKIKNGQLLFPPDLSNQFKDLINKLLIRDPNKRLGSGPNDFQHIMQHPFFKNIDWIKLYDKEINPPYKPKLREDKSIEPLMSVETPLIDTPEPITCKNDVFQDFQFSVEIPSNPLIG